MKVGDLVILKELEFSHSSITALKEKYGIGLVTELWNRRPVCDVEVWWPKNHPDCSRTMSVDILEIVNESR